MIIAIENGYNEPYFPDVLKPEFVRVDANKAPNRQNLQDREEERRGGIPHDER